MSAPQRKRTLLQAAGHTYFPVAFLARVPFAMMVVGILTLISSARDSVALGGLTSAMAGLGTAVVGPLLGMAADRWGQRTVMLLAAIGNSIALLALAWVAYAPVGDGWVLAVAVLVGATAPQVAPLSRSRLVAMIDRYLPSKRRPKVLQGVLAYESAADEIVFVFGPVLVGLLATTMSPAAPIVGAAVLTLFFVVAFALHRSAREVPTHLSQREAIIAPVTELFRPRIIVLVLGMLGMGLFFGSTLTSLTAFMDDVATLEEAGLLYGAMGLGSAILALCVAAFPAKFTLAGRWLTFAIILVGGAALIAYATDRAGMLVALTLAGIGVGPTLVTLYTLAAERTPAGRSATLMTTAGSAIIVGQSSSSAVVGSVAESTGVTAALVAPAIAAAIVLVAGIWNSLLTAREHARTPVASDVLVEHDAQADTEVTVSVPVVADRR